LSLADVYDALTTRRPYKDAWSHRRAVEWIGERGGSQFDPDVISIFLSRSAEFDSERERLADEDSQIELS
jgi:putative two-component system response regulator